MNQIVKATSKSLNTTATTEGSYLRSENQSGKNLADIKSAQDAEFTQDRNSQEENTSPDGGYGWVCVACIFLVNAHTWGVNSVRF